MIDLAPGRELCAQRRQLLIVRREDVGIEAGVLNFPFPLITPEVVARLEREHNKAQEKRHTPKNDRRPAAGRQLAKEEAAAKNAIPQSTAVSTNFTGIEA